MIFSKLNFLDKVFHQIITLSFLLLFLKIVTMMENGGIIGGAVMMTAAMTMVAAKRCFNLFIVIGGAGRKGLCVKHCFGLLLWPVFCGIVVVTKKTSFYATECAVGSLVSLRYHQNTSGEVDSGERTVSPSTSLARYYHLIRSILCLLFWSNQ